MKLWILNIVGNEKLVCLPDIGWDIRWLVIRGDTADLDFIRNVFNYRVLSSDLHHT